MNKWRYWKRYCYYFVSSFKTWKEANSSCSRFRASELLWIEDQDDLVGLFLNSKLFLFNLLIFFLTVILFPNAVLATL